VRVLAHGLDMQPALDTLGEEHLEVLPGPRRHVRPGLGRELPDTLPLLTPPRARQSVADAVVDLVLEPERLDYRFVERHPSLPSMIARRAGWSSSPCSRCACSMPSPTVRPGWRGSWRPLPPLRLSWSTSSGSMIVI